MVAVLAVALVLLAVVTWNSVAWPRVSSRQSDGTRGVSVLVPARDEEANLPACLEAIRAQGAIVREVLVYDDRSKDRTADVVVAASADDPRIRLLASTDLPAGWHGKPHACHKLSESAQSDWLLFVDADARLAEGAAARLVAEAEARGVTMLAPWPGLVMSSTAELLLMPLLNFVVFTLFPAPMSLRSRLPSLGLAHGACLLFRREEYESVGGHALVRSELFEDTSFARAWRANGFAGICLDGQDVVRVRMYRSFGGIWSGFLKNFHPAFGTVVGFWLFLALHVSVYVLPWGVAAWGLALGQAAPIAWTACAAGICARLVQCARFGYPVWSAAVHPIAETVLVALGLTSWYRYRLGGGVEWKGRRYHG